MTDFLKPEMLDKDIEIHGDYDARFEPVVRVLRKQVAHFGGGASASVFLEGECVVDVWAGQARHDGTPWAKDTMSLCFSTSKGVAATAIHILATDGLLDYDAPVAQYWPEFGQKGKEIITVRQVLAHQAGLHRTTPLIDDLTDILDWDKIVSRLEITEPDFHPGTANGYHAMTFGWLVGEIVHRVSGMSFTDFVQKRIVEPLGLDGMHIGNAEAELDRVADLVGLPAIRRHDAEPLPDGYRAPAWLPKGTIRNLLDRGLTPAKMAELVTHPSFWNASIPAMNGVFTARSLAKMYSALSLGGALDGTRLVSPDIVRRAAQVQMKRPDKVVLYPLHWRLGYHRADALLMDVPSAFGHYGTGGAGAWANPDHKLSAALVHNGFPLSLTGQARTAFLTPAVYESLGLYKGLLDTIRRGPIIEFLPERERRPAARLASVKRAIPKRVTRRAA
jgi:CubicO group peptidase (beta-lactamase class C family)